MICVSGTETGDYGDDDMFERSSSQFDISCDSFDLDSISQISLADSVSNSVADLYKASLPHANMKSVSTDNIPSELGYHPRSGFPHNFVRSKLSVLPEEQATLTRKGVKDGSRLRPGSMIVTSNDQGPQSLSSDVNMITPELISTPTNNNIRRKRSQSLADIQV